MACKVELSKQQLTQALELQIASMKRAKNAKNANPLIVAIIDKDIHALNTAVSSITEVK